MNDKIKKIFFWAIQLLPLILAGIWVFNLYMAYITLPPPGVQQAPISRNKIFALVAFMLGYGVFLGLYHFSKRKK